VFRVSLSDGIGIAGMVFTIILVVLDKAGKLRGGWLFALLCVAGVMTAFVALGNTWVTEAPERWKLWRGALMLSIVVLGYSALIIWISEASREEQGPTVSNTATAYEPPATPRSQQVETHDSLTTRSRPPAAVADKIQMGAESQFREKLPETAYVSLGGGGITMEVPMASLVGKDKPGPINVGGMVPVRLHVTRNVLYCDVTVWGGQGQPAIEIKNNEFSVRPPGWDRNYSTNAVEVVDGAGVPVFQIIRRTPSHYVVNGYFPFPDGRTILATDQGTTVASGSITIPRDALRPIFKYPSWKYLGKYADGSN